ncbi:MAG: hypothetical protein JO112_07290 [Planctomycetes bacterium]|nr:hypothetical protein [Planctomycetota bacterium]
MNITCTIGQKETPAWVAEFLDGTRQGAVHFAFGQRINHVYPGDYLYLIHRGKVQGRLRITEVVEDAELTLPAGNEHEPIEAKTVVWVHCPGEPVGHRDIPRDSHRGFRYDEVSEWGS